MPIERTPNSNLLSLEGKVAIVTGGALGIGLEVARRLAEADARVVIADLNHQAGIQAIQQLSLSKDHFIQTDVTDPGNVDRMVQFTISRFYGIDILVNNAGIYPFKPTLDMSFEEWQKVITTNLNSTFLVNQAAARQMVKQGRGGRIINIGSVDSLRPWMVGSAAYDASKAGILGMSKSLALELSPHGITVNVIAPGDIDTPGSRPDGTEPIDLTTPKIPLGRRGTADDVAKIVLGLASPMGDYVTGTIIPVDGGWLLTSSNS